MSEKIIGYILLTLGVVIIFVSSFSVFTVFTGRAKPVQLFNFESVSIDFSQIVSASLPTTDLPEELKGSIPKNTAPSAKTEIIKGDMLNTTSNIFAHLVLMGFLASSGLKLAQIGVNLLRPIIVKLKEEKLLKEVKNQQVPS